MNIGILCQYYYPETIGAAPVFLRELAIDLMAKGHRVTVFTAFPNYPERIAFEGYRGKLFQVEEIDGARVVRSWIYANPAETYASRLMNWGSFCVSSLFSGLFSAGHLDVLYVLLPPLPLGITASWLAALKGFPVVTNIQDIYPLIAIELGILKDRRLIAYFERMERTVYARSRHIVVISEGFKANLMSKGVPEDKISVIPNWADPSFIEPGPKENSFRADLGVGDRFTLVYSGGLTRNSNLEPMIEAAALLRDEPFAFAIVGDGAMKAELTTRARELALSNLQFRDFQPLERYPEVLQSGDMTLVTLNSAATFASVPSKVFKQMAAGRPVLAVTANGNELSRLIAEAECGLCVPPDAPRAMVDALIWARTHPDELAEMGRNARAYLEEHHGRSKCVDMIEGVLLEAGGAD